jgi:CBS-domain-containing membrane protein
MDIRNWLMNTRASDLMIRNVVTLTRGDTLSHAASLMLKEQVTGLPVVDETGNCVGVLSAIDIVQAEDQNIKERNKIADSAILHSSLALPIDIYEEQLMKFRDKVGPITTQTVEQFMTDNLVSVRENDSLLKIVRFMVDAHVHRVVVLQEDHRLAGIVATTDVMAALLRHADVLDAQGDY